MSDEVTDLSFALVGDTIADDYALLLWQALVARLPWLAEDEACGVLPLAGLSRGEGLRFVSRRARLVLRLPRRRLAEADFLVGAELDLGGKVAVGAATERPLAPAKVVHSHCVDMDCADEGEFLARSRAALEARGLRGELVCGRRRGLRGEHGPRTGYSLMLYGLAGEQTVDLQMRGLGLNHGLGCGLFVPHKNVAAVSGD